jgi:hypothetical protein
MTGEREPSSSRAHERPLFGRQIALLEQDGVGNANLADVMQGRGLLDALALLGGPAQIPGRHAAVQAQPLNVRAGFLIAKAGRLHQSGERIQIAGFELGAIALLRGIRLLKIGCVQA